MPLAPRRSPVAPPPCCLAKGHSENAGAGDFQWAAEATRVGVWNCSRCGKEQQDGWPYHQVGRERLCWYCPLEMLEDMATRSHQSGQYTIGVVPMEVHRIMLMARRRKKTQVPKKLRAEILRRFKFICVGCGETRNLTVDHIIPAIKGGSDSAENLQILCRSCNSKKGTRTRWHP